MKCRRCGLEDQAWSRDEPAHGCGCDVETLDFSPDEPRDEDHERAVQHARDTDWADTNGRDWS